MILASRGCPWEAPWPLEAALRAVLKVLIRILKAKLHHKGVTRTAYDDIMSDSQNNFIANISGIKFDCKNPILLEQQIARDK